MNRVGNFRFPQEGKFGIPLTHCRASYGRQAVPTSVPRARRPPQRTLDATACVECGAGKPRQGVMCPIPLPEGMSSEHRTRWHDKDQKYSSEAALCRVSDYLVSF